MKQNIYYLYFYSLFDHFLCNYVLRTADRAGAFSLSHGNNRTSALNIAVPHRYNTHINTVRPAAAPCISRVLVSSHNVAPLYLLIYTKHCTSLHLSHTLHCLIRSRLRQRSFYTQFSFNQSPQFLSTTASRQSRQRQSITSLF